MTVSGWSRTTRNADAGKLLFVELNDGSTSLSIQCVMKNTSTGFDNCKASGGTGASFTFTGELVESEGKGQSCEIQVIKGECVGPVYGGEVSGSLLGWVNKGKWVRKGFRQESQVKPNLFRYSLLPPRTWPSEEPTIPSRRRATASSTFASMLTSGPAPRFTPPP